MGQLRVSAASIHSVPALLGIVSLCTLGTGYADESGDAAMSVVTVVGTGIIRYKLDLYSTLTGCV